MHRETLSATKPRRLRLSRLLTRIAGTLLALALLAAGVVLAGSEWILRRSHSAPLPSTFALPLAMPTTSAPGADASDDEGRRLAVLVGCLKGCHGPEGEGGVVDAPPIFRAEAPPLGAVLPLYSDEALVRLVRFGIRGDGKSAVGMPSATFFPLGDEDLGRIISHLRRRPGSPRPSRSVRVEPLGRLALVLGEWRISADEVDPASPRWGEQTRRTAFERGRYLASITCSECHGGDLAGNEYFASPSLAIARAYDLPGFTRLLREGVHLSGRREGLMSETARAAFAELTDAEILDLHEFLTSRFAP